MSSIKRKRNEGDTTTDKRPPKRPKNNITPLDIFSDIISYYRLKKWPKYFDPLALEFKLMNNTHFKGSSYIPLTEHTEEDIARECGIWNDVTRSEIPKISIKNHYLDVRKVLICMYAPVEVVLKFLSKRVKMRKDRKTYLDPNKPVCEQTPECALLQLALGMQLTPSCGNKRCVNWRHYLNHNKTESETLCVSTEYKNTSEAGD